MVGHLNCLALFNKAQEFARSLSERPYANCSHVLNVAEFSFYSGGQYECHLPLGPTLLSRYGVHRPIE